MPSVVTPLNVAKSPPTTTLPSVCNAAAYTTSVRPAAPAPALNVVSIEPSVFSRTMPAAAALLKRMKFPPAMIFAVGLKRDGLNIISAPHAVAGHEGSIQAAVGVHAHEPGLLACRCKR